MTAAPLAIGLVTEAMIKRPLVEVMDWLVREVPAITGLELGAGAYAPTNHCDMPRLLADAGARDAFRREIGARGLHIAALNVWGNPLHPDPAIGTAHDGALRDAVRLAAELGVERIVGMAGCPAAIEGERAPHFAAGGWLPYLEHVHERQWQARVHDYWSEVGAFAQATHPSLLICLELHPGTVAYNVETFERLAALGPAIAANIDPSHFFWMGMDANKVVRRLGRRIGHAHGKDVVFQAEQLALNGLLDRRWPAPPEEMPWNFATVGRGHNAAWWTALLDDLRAAGNVRTISIEHEDPFVAPEVGIREAAELLSTALTAAEAPA
ncbi:MAG TPA: sugar phosphate isomerase/epimerase [Acetobacteraceae bacterium]|nr:sugar phosphate isomerase/epimerase [Acetobacteraceae bacterium]